jgi:hypothetical protein
MRRGVDSEVGLGNGGMLPVFAYSRCSISFSLHAITFSISKLCIISPVLDGAVQKVKVDTEPKLFAD